MIDSTKYKDIIIKVAQCEEKDSVTLEEIFQSFKYRLDNEEQESIVGCYPAPQDLTRDERKEAVDRLRSIPSFDIRRELSAAGSVEIK